MDKRCRMIMRGGERCSRPSTPGGLGFCWQHVPVQKKGEREKWKLRVDEAALAVATIDLLLKIIELAVGHLHEFFGPGNSQTRARNKLQLEFPGSVWQKIPERYVPGSRVDWQTLLELYDDARAAAQSNNLCLSRDLEVRFDQWFLKLNQYHRGELLAAIEDRTK